jgi:hypothetical protein
MYSVPTNINLHVNAIVELKTMKTGKYQELLACVYKHAQMKWGTDSVHSETKQ